MWNRIRAPTRYIVNPVVNLIRVAKDYVFRNNVIVIMILNLTMLGIFGYGFVSKKWFKLKNSENPKIEIWGSLMVALVIEYKGEGEQEKKISTRYTYNKFVNQDCLNHDLEISCDSVLNFKYAGIVAALLIFIGLLLLVVHIC